MAISKLTISQLSSVDDRSPNGAQCAQELALALRLYHDKCDTTVFNPGLVQQWGEFTVDGMIRAVGLSPEHTRYGYADRGLDVASPYGFARISGVKFSGGMDNPEQTNLLAIRDYIDTTLIPEIGRTMMFGGNMTDLRDVLSTTIAKLLGHGISRVRLSFEGKDRDFSFAVYSQGDIRVSHTVGNFDTRQDCTLDDIIVVLENILAVSYTTSTAYR